MNRTEIIKLIDKLQKIAEESADLDTQYDIFRIIEDLEMKL